MAVHGLRIWCLLRSTELIHEWVTTGNAPAIFIAANVSPHSAERRTRRLCLCALTGVLLSLIVFVQALSLAPFFNTTRSRSLKNRAQTIATPKNGVGLSKKTDFLTSTTG